MEALRSRPDVATVRLVRFDSPGQALRAHQVRLHLGDGAPVLARTRGITPLEEGLIWVGSIGKDPELQVLTVEGEEASGRIRVDDTVYMIEAIGAGFYAISALNPSWISMPDGFGENTDIQVDARPEGDAAMQPASGSTNIDVLVVYTSAASSGIGSLIASAETQTNTALANSGANASIDVVYYQQIGYTESGSLVTDTNRLRNPSDTYFDGVHNLRDQYGADIVVLIVNSGTDYSGWADEINASASTAFATVRKAEMTSELVFAHEIGHLVGNRHDKDSDQEGGIYPWSHGFVNKSGGSFQTLMSIFLDNFSQTRITYFSTPNKTYQGIPIGTATNEDNTRVWNERAATVAAFRNEPTPPISVNITGPTLLGWKDDGILTANVSGGTGSYAYQWYYQPSGTSQWVNTGVTTQQYYFEMTWTSGVDFKVVVSSGNQTEEDTHHVDYCSLACPSPYLVDVEEDPETPAHYVLEQNYPNPFNPATEIGFALPATEHVELVVYDVMGRAVVTLLDTSLPAGYHQVRFDGADLPSGTYLYRIAAGDFQQIRPMVLLQ